MNDFYQIDEIGKMEYLSNLSCFSSAKEFEIEDYNHLEKSIGLFTVSNLFFIQETIKKCFTNKKPVRT